MLVYVSPAIPQKKPPKREYIPRLSMRIQDAIRDGTLQRKKIFFGWSDEEVLSVMKAIADTNGENRG